MRLHVLDLDCSVAGQPFLGGLIAAGEARYTHVRDLAPRLRIVANRRTLEILGGRMGTARGGEPEVIFYGSGDFHHLTFQFLQRLDEPVTVLHFDNHPDWVRFPRTVNCGSWVARALETANVRKVITIGPCSDDLACPQLKGADLGAIRKRRLEIYAWHAAPTRLWGAALSAPGVETVAGRLVWRNLAGEDWNGFVDELIRSLPHTAVWITIDKDVLSPEEAFTNWDQGQMNVDQIARLLRAVATSRRIAGADICGDYSPPRCNDAFRAVLSWLDHPAIALPGESELAVNDTTNSRLAGIFREVLQ
jgi:hypothetical protein